MPTLGNMKIPAPNSWEEFESIVKSALELRWGFTNLTMHGRQGQSQKGVDIYGREGDNLVGVQCKLTVKSINESIIDKEVSLADTFQPIIASLYIATTSPSDVKLQQYVRNMTVARALESKFSVEILFWNDITHDLCKDINAIRRHYPELFFNQEYEQLPISDLRQRDIESVKELLEFIDVVNIHYAIEMAPKSVCASFLCASDNFIPILGNPSFYIHNEELRLSLYSWFRKWNEIIIKGRFIYDYQDNTHRLLFPMPMDCCRNPEESEIYEQLVELYREYRISFNDFTQLIHDHYSEINFNETSAKARR